MAWLMLLTVSLNSCGEKSEAAKTQETDPIPVKTMALSTENTAATIAAAGQFTTDDEVYLSFKTGGILQTLYVEEGQAVRKGQLLATLNTTEIDAQVQQAQLALEKAKRDHARVTNLYEDSVATLEQLQNSKTALEVATQQWESARFNREYAEIHAPHRGYVLRKLAREGQVVSPGTPILQANGAGSAQWLLKVGVSDREWAMIQPADQALVETTAMPGRQWSARVLRKSQSADPQSGSFTVDVALEDAQTAPLATGMFGKATITTNPASGQHNSQYWAIPYDALLDGEGSTGYVFVTNDGKMAEKVEVTIAGIEKDQVIVSDGLQEADALIIAGSAYLTDSSIIRVIE